MKKYISVLLYLTYIVVISFILASCGVEEPNPIDKPNQDDKPNPIDNNINFFSAAYAGDQLGIGAHVFYMAFLSDDIILENGKIQGDGEAVEFALFAANKSELFPANGDYFLINKPEVNGSIVQLKSVEDGVLGKAIKLISGKVSIKGTEKEAIVEIDLVLDDGSSRDYYYSGAILVEDETRLVDSTSKCN